MKSDLSDEKLWTGRAVETAMNAFLQAQRKLYQNGPKVIGPMRVSFDEKTQTVEVMWDDCGFITSIRQFLEYYPEYKECFQGTRMWAMPNWKIEESRPTLPLLHDKEED